MLKKVFIVSAVCLVFLGAVVPETTKDNGEEIVTDIQPVVDRHVRQVIARTRTKRAIPAAIIPIISQVVGSNLVGKFGNILKSGKVANMTEDLVTKIIGKLSEEILSKNHKDDIAAELKTYLDSFDNQTDEKRKALEAQLKAIADGLTGKHKDLIGSASTIDIIPQKGFELDGMFSPPGYKIQTETSNIDFDEPATEPESAYKYNQGLGNTLLNGCFGPALTAHDPCYASKTLIPKCQQILDGANFIGVGFDGRGDYSASSRKKSLIQRHCNKGGSYKGKGVPDAMTVLGVYDTEVRTQSFNGIEQYREYLEEKSAVAKSKWMFMDAVTKATGHASGGFLGLFGAGGGGSFSASASGSAQSTSASSTASGHQNSHFKQTYMSSLEVNVIRYEIFMDDVTFNDLNEDFLHDFVMLPQSYFHSGAPLRFQNFIQRWGTHFIKSAKFGGQLKLIKTKEGTKDESIEQFAAKAQQDYKAMFSTLIAATAQFKSRGLFHKAEASSETTVGAGGGSSGTSTSSTQSGNHSISQQQYSNEVMMVQGGSQTIAAVISEMYTTGFKYELAQWLKSIPRYPKPYEFQMELITDLCMNVNFKQLFPVGVVDFGCFGEEDILTENGTGRRYYVWKELDVENNTIHTERRYCDYTNQQGLEDALMRRCKSLQRAINIYMEEGPVRSSDIHLRPGRFGCKTSLLAFDDKRTDLRTPKWTKMGDGTHFKVIFDMIDNIPGVAGSSEALSVFYRNKTNKWYVQSATGITHLYDGKGNGGSSDLKNNKISVRGLVMTFDSSTGLLTVTAQDFAASKQILPHLPDFVNGATVARVEFPSMLAEIQKHKNEFGIGTIPCNVVWSNAHRFNPVVEGGKCISFSAISAGDIFVVFSAIPRDYRTWYYVQISPRGVAIYKGATVMKFVDDRNARSLGDPRLYESYFVCVSENVGEKTTITYGKTEDNRDRGHVFAVFEDIDEPLHVRFFAFGNGEREVNIMDAHVLPTSATGEHVCVGGTVDFQGTCVEHCHPECVGCHKSDSATSCRACKNLQLGDKCVAECPPTHKPDSNNETCICMHYQDGECVEACSPDRYLDASSNPPVCKCKTYMAGEEDSCLSSCPAHTYQTNLGQKTECRQCNAACIPQEDTGYDTCTGPSGNQCHECVKIGSSCANCAAGTFLFKKPDGTYQCKACAPGNMCPGDGRAYRCNINEYSAANRRSCVACPGYKPYSTLPVSNKCHSCRPGFYMPSTSSSCRRCMLGYAGANCQVRCSCRYGRCIQSTGQCSCYRGFKGEKCDIPSEGAIRLIDGRRILSVSQFVSLQDSTKTLASGGGTLSSGTLSSGTSSGGILSRPLSTSGGSTSGGVLSRPLSTSGGSFTGTFTRGKRALSGFSASLSAVPLVPEKTVVDGTLQLQPDLTAASDELQVVPVSTTSSKNKLEGRVEIFHNGQWGTVCDNTWTSADAKVVCKQFGYNNGTAMKGGYYGAGSGYIWLESVQCLGREYWLKDCAKSRWGAHTCRHQDDVGVICSNTGFTLTHALATDSLQFAALVQRAK